MNGIREMNELHVPVGTPIKLTMISQDVIHSFYLPAMRIKRDVIPGRYTTVWFQPTKVGRYRLLCTEYCGTQHSLMGGWIYVMEKDDFERWYRTGGETAGSAGAGNAGGPGQGGGLAVAGAQLFQSNGCTNCHAAPGAIARAPTLVGIYGKKQPLDNGRSVVADDAYIRESILYPKAKVVKGYQSIMPPYQGLLTEEQVLQLTAYIRALGDPKGAAATQLQQGNPVIGDRAGSVTGGGNPASTQNIQDDFIQSGNPTQYPANPAATSNIQDQFIQQNQTGR
jgi:cytochrome c oxidase subunit 2